MSGILCIVDKPNEISQLLGKPITGNNKRLLIKILKDGLKLAELPYIEPKIVSMYNKETQYLEDNSNILHSLVRIKSIIQELDPDLIILVGKNVRDKLKKVIVDFYFLPDMSSLRGVGFPFVPDYLSMINNLSVHLKKVML